MKVPNADQAYIDMRKLEAYTLDTEHEYGKHKARVFAAALGLTLEHTDLLREALLEAVKEQEATLGLKDEYGQRYTVEFEMTGPNQKTTTIRRGWIIHPDEDFPRLVTAYVV